MMAIVPQIPPGQQYPPSQYSNNMDDYWQQQPHDHGYYQRQQQQPLPPDYWRKPRRNRYRPRRQRPGGPPRCDWWYTDTASESSSASGSNHSGDASKIRSSSSSSSSNKAPNNDSAKKGKQHRGYPQSVHVPQDQHDQYVALDCEMVGVGDDGTDSALARVTVIDWYGTVLLDEYVKQEHPVTDFRTHVSGITPEVLRSRARLNLAICRQLVLNLIRGKVLVGHALQNDLDVLGISHPWYMTRDTAVYEPFMKLRFDDGVLWPRGLKDLCRERLKREIQVYGKPHCSYEDALAALDLYRCVRLQWEKSIASKVQTSRRSFEYQQPRYYGQYVMY